jgi:hypothetical protein
MLRESAVPGQPIAAICEHKTCSQRLSFLFRSVARQTPSWPAPCRCGTRRRASSASRPRPCCRRMRSWTRPCAGWPTPGSARSPTRCRTGSPRTKSARSATLRERAGSCGPSPACPGPGRSGSSTPWPTRIGPAATPCAPCRSPTPPSKCCAPTRTFPRDRSPRSCGSGRTIASGWGRATCSSSTRPRPWQPPGRAIS